MRMPKFFVQQSNDYNCIVRNTLLYCYAPQSPEDYRLFEQLAKKATAEQLATYYRRSTKIVTQLQKDQSTVKDNWEFFYVRFVEPVMIQLRYGNVDQALLDMCPMLDAMEKHLEQGGK